MTDVTVLRHTVRANYANGIEWTQADLAYEQLMREHHGKVDTMNVSLFPTSEAASTNELISEIAKELSQDVRVSTSRASKRRNLVLFVGSDTVCHLAKQDKTILDQLFIATANSDVIKKIFDRVEQIGYTVEVKEENNKIPVTFALPVKDGVNYSRRDFGIVPLDSVRQNYTPEVVKATESAIAAIKKADNGVLVINGDPGTGKSYLIRSILSELREKHVIICTPPTQFLTNMSLLVMASQASDKPSLMVMEDIGDLLAEDNVTHHLDETSNFLNLTDGLLSLLIDAVFIVSFNHDMAAINPALTRPGRCLGQIKVGLLPAEQASELTGLEVSRATTLAEVYEMKRTGERPKTATKSIMPGMGSR